MASIYVCMHACMHVFKLPPSTVPSACNSTECYVSPAPKQGVMS